MTRNEAIEILSIAKRKFPFIFERMNKENAEKMIKEFMECSLQYEEAKRYTSRMIVETIKLNGFSAKFIEQRLNEEKETQRRTFEAIDRMSAR